MKPAQLPTTLSIVRCAIYTRKSTEEGLEQEFNSLDAQREAAQAYIQSQQQEGWACLPDRYDDGGFTGGNMDRPALRQLLADIAAGKVDVIVVYKVDRLTRSLADFARIVEQLDRAGASFVSVTQAFNTTTSMGRLTLNVLLSFAQFEREVTSERIRDKVAASKRKGMWMGGPVPIGYQLAAETTTDGTPIRRYSYGAGRIGVATPSGGQGYYHTDPQGSVRAVTDSSATPAAVIMPKIAWAISISTSVKPCWAERRQDMKPCWAERRQGMKPCWAERRQDMKPRAFIAPA